MLSVMGTQRLSDIFDNVIAAGLQAPNPSSPFTLSSNTQYLQYFPFGSELSGLATIPALPKPFSSVSSGSLLPYSAMLHHGKAGDQKSSLVSHLEVSLCEWKMKRFQMTIVRALTLAHFASVGLKTTGTREMQEAFPRPLSTKVDWVIERCRVYVCIPPA